MHSRLALVLVGVIVVVALASRSHALPMRVDDAAARTSRAQLSRDGRVDVVASPAIVSAPFAAASPPSASSQFLWPYPPQFESYLPSDAKNELLAIFLDLALTPDERTAKVNAVFDALPLDTIARLPLPEGFERLPADIHARIEFVHSAPGFRWAERQMLIHEIVAALPETTRRLMSSKLEGPPPGFEHVLSPTVYKQLLAVHYNRALSKPQKSDLITRIMRQVPQEQIDRLPLPAGMQQLPAEMQMRLRSLVYDYTVPQRVRAARVHAFVASLPAEVRPPL